MYIKVDPKTQTIETAIGTTLKISDYGSKTSTLGNYDAP